MQRPPKSLFSVFVSLNFKLQTPSHSHTHAMGEEETEQVSSSFFSHPLFSCFITLYVLILIYFPIELLRISLSPVLLISGALLLSLLYHGSTRESNTRPDTSNENLEETAEDYYSNVVLVQDSDKKPDHLTCGFVEWNLRAPLEVIHEAYEENDEDEEEEENPGGEKDPTRFKEIVRFPSLSLCYPESDSDSDSASSSEFNFPEIGDWNSPENMGFRWEEEDDGGGTGGGEGLIEIKLDRSYNNNKSKMMMMSKWNQTELDFHGEDEDGLIEIDLFP
ncbi:PREDICTED: uncharacterized protein LOC104731391 [Camelina sativa]|uniref:Uncharacterized protein LOC104731391 n=1 Tax=Camelina sativa TaxID=90675 RepID=A0ABM0V0N6_CAMSA|nr:PREDICTED: uncharacterized protein LOC104731391 [Camelina sativa]